MKKGFTLIELLVVIAIIGILSGIVMTSLNTARQRSRVAKAQSELTSIRNGIALMSIDTGLWPNGCLIGVVVGNGGGGGSTNEVSLADPQAGIMSAPSVGQTDPECDWTASAVAAWNGPYSSASPTDPWGHPYWFDNDYYPRQDCPTNNANPGVAGISAVVSLGPNGTGGPLNLGYDCDDIFISLY